MVLQWPDIHVPDQRIKTVAFVALQLRSVQHLPNKNADDLAFPVDGSDRFQVVPKNLL